MNPTQIDGLTNRNIPPPYIEDTSIFALFLKSSLPILVGVIGSAEALSPQRPDNHALFTAFWKGEGLWFGLTDGQSESANGLSTRVARYLFCLIACNCSFSLCRQARQSRFTFS
jgi:hypothetical protein